jgi:hypothetical protein
MDEGAESWEVQGRVQQQRAAVRLSCKSSAEGRGEGGRSCGLRRRLPSLALFSN